MRDADVRVAVKRHLDGLHAGESDTRIVEEMGIWSGTVRIDLAVINGELAGYELKSNSDTLDRLPYQIEIYSKVFDRVTLVVGDKLHKKAAEMIPNWWGCTIATMRSGLVQLRQGRKGKRNPNLDLPVVAQLLWREEALGILDAYGFADGWRSKRASEICDRLVECLSAPMLADEVRSALKRRDWLRKPVSDKGHVTI